MAVIPIKIDPSQDLVTVQDDGHVGDISFTNDVVFFRDSMQNNSEDIRFLLMVCPICGAVSKHPVSGGADPLNVQKLFVYKLKERHPGRSFAQAKVLTRELVSAQDGLWRWQQENMLEGD